MPRKSQFRRLRRLHVVGMVGLLAASAGLGIDFSAVGDALASRPGGWAGVVAGLVLLASGGGGVAWALLSRDAVAAAERAELRARGLDDALPMGAFAQGERVGLESSDQWLVWGTVLASVGLLLAAAAATDPQVGWESGLVFGLVGFVPAAACFRVGTGTRLWLTPEGVERTRWPRRTVRWTDVTRVVPLEHGSPVPSIAAADGIELQLPPATRGWRRLGGVDDLTIRCQFLAVSAPELLALIEERAPASLGDGRAG